MLIRWLLVGVVAIGLGVAALELSACVADERQRHAACGLASEGGESQLPIGAEIDGTEASALPRLTH